MLCFSPDRGWCCTAGLFSVCSGGFSKGNAIDLVEETTFLKHPLAAPLLQLPLLVLSPQLLLGGGLGWPLL